MKTLIIFGTLLLALCRCKPLKKEVAKKSKPGTVEPREPWEINREHGMKLFEGDIVDHPHVRQSTSRNAVNNKDGLWLNYEIPYLFEGAYTYEERLIITKALSEFGGRTCNTFRLKEDSDINFIAIIRGNGCYSSVGMTNGRQTLSLGEGCITKGIVQHEAMHAVGFWHEQSRYDRDTFVQIMWENIIPGEEGNFNKYSNETITTLGLDYDYSSIMHYGPKYFSKNGEDTIVLSKERKEAGETAHMGQRDHFTDLDLDKQRTLYGCDVNQFVGWSAWSSWSECDTECKKQRWRWCNSGECVGDDYQPGNCTDCEAGDDPDCGETHFTGKIGTISSPFYPNNYKNYADCSYTITAADPNSPIYLSFLRFGIELEPITCGYDYLAIYKNGIGEAEAYLCGSQPPDDQIYEAGSLKLMFHSDPSISDVGFRILYFNAPVIKLWGFEKASDDVEWVQASNDDFDWTRQSGPTPSAGTGPPFDHTFNDQNGHYMFIETSSPQYGPMVAGLISPIVDPITEGACVQFFYHMYGQYMGTLNVYLLTYESNGSITSSLIMSEDGDHGIDWQVHKFTPPIGKRFQMKFEAIRGGGYLSDIALDDIGIFGLKCSEL